MTSETGTECAEASLSEFGESKERGERAPLEKQSYEKENESYGKQLDW